MQPVAQYAAVLVDAGGPAARRPFDYLIPSELTGKVGIGSLVIVPFGPRTLRGLVVGLPEAPAVPHLRPISSLYGSSALADQHAAMMAAFVAARYACSEIEAYRAVLPAAIGGRPVRTWGLGPADAPDLGDLPPDLEDAYALIRVDGSVTASGAAAALGVSLEEAVRRLRALQAQGLAAVEAQDRGAPGHRARASYAALPLPEAADERVLAARAPKQYALWRWLRDQAGPATLDGYPGATDAAQRAAAALQQRGLISRHDLRPGDAGQEVIAGLGGAGGVVRLTSAQAGAVSTVLAGAREAQGTRYLLYGVTGSGKTEVYLQTIAGVLAMGRQALVLVPEISLTPQAVARFAGRFPGKVALLHSRMAAGERTRAWRELSRGELAIAIGPRSAAFAPLPRLGLIVVDEEHEPSYKQEDIPRYDAREVVSARARMTGAPVLYGSATPTLEVMARTAKAAALVGGAIAGPADTCLLELPARIDGRPLPPVSVVDMRAELRQGNRAIFSGLLAAELEATLGRREQAILFLNRRGLATFVLCRECGYVARCPQCDVALVLHGHENRLRCHYCGHAARPPTVCPACSGSRIRYFGAGTQRVEAYVRERFPASRVARLDSDVAARRGRTEEVLAAFAGQEIDVLVGTQMIGKGLDLPQVTLVGVVAADTSLSLPDFRAAERTFTLITQVAGRAGRGDRPGRVVVQSYNPDHYSLKHAAAHDYEGFARQELAYRRQLGYPPFWHIGLVRLSGEDETATAGAARAAGDVIRNHDGARPGERGVEVSVLGPSPAPLYRLQGRYRWHIVLKDTDAASLARTMHELLGVLQQQLGASIRVSVDVDPQALL
jgi:primosomal protein N' (replication factor Y)